MDPTSSSRDLFSRSGCHSLDFSPGASAQYSRSNGCGRACVIADCSHYSSLRGHGIYHSGDARIFKLGAGAAVGGVLALTLARELGPVLTAVIIAGRVGSAFAAEIGTMRVTEQIDALQILKTDPIDYLVIPRVIACALMLPLLNVLSFITGMTGGLLIATSQYGIPS